MERSHTASSVEVSRFDGDSYSDIPKFSWHEATREYREEELQRNTIASRISETSIRPSTREKALPFQMKLVEIKTNRLKYSIEEQKTNPLRNEEENCFRKLVNDVTHTSARV